MKNNIMGEEFKVLNTHLYLKEGLIISREAEFVDYGYDVYNLGVNQVVLPCYVHLDWIESGWIKKIKEDADLPKEVL